jgi:hypothetical protein
MTGSYIDSSNVNHGFIRDKDGSITTFDAPEAGTGAPCGGTYPFSMNPKGVITGWYIDANCVYHGFQRIP